MPLNARLAPSRSLAAERRILVPHQAAKFFADGCLSRRVTELFERRAAVSERRLVAAAIWPFRIRIGNDAAGKFVKLLRRRFRTKDGRKRTPQIFTLAAKAEIQATCGGGGEIVVLSMIRPGAKRRLANPSMASWPEGAAYIEQQRRRLPTHKFRRLHLNLPGAPNGAFFDQGAVMAAIPTGIKVRPFQKGIEYRAYCDMSGGSLDDATLCLGHSEGKRAVLDLVMKQAGSPPFNPRAAVARFARTLHEYDLTTVTGDAYAGQTFRCDFEEHGIMYRVGHLTASENYERMEPRLNAGEIELLDDPTLIEQLLCLVVRGSKVDHQAGGQSQPWWSPA